MAVHRGPSYGENRLELRRSLQVRPRAIRAIDCGEGFFVLFCEYPDHLVSGFGGRAGLRRSRPATGSRGRNWFGFLGRGTKRVDAGNQHWRLLLFAGHFYRRGQVHARRRASNVRVHSFFFFLLISVKRKASFQWHL